VNLVRFAPYAIRGYLFGRIHYIYQLACSIKQPVAPYLNASGQESFLVLVYSSSFYNHKAENYCGLLIG
jgi:hypothetical protein